MTNASVEPNSTSPVIATLPRSRYVPPPTSGVAGRSAPVRPSPPTSLDERDLAGLDASTDELAAASDRFVEACEQALATRFVEAVLVAHPGERRQIELTPPR